MENSEKINILRAERVNLIRKEQKLTQVEFGKITNLSQQSINRIEKRKQALTEQNARAIINAFPDYRLEWLLGYDDFKNIDDFFEHKHTIGKSLESAANILIEYALNNIRTKENIKDAKIESYEDMSLITSIIINSAKSTVLSYIQNKIIFQKNIDHTFLDDQDQ